ncbi:hypothetical protein UA32_17430 [Photobacterium angustum]|uniref:Uncharacterized protein n=1 Tax=Photobacterium angustum TaxID=661 RepID=A0ABX5H5Z9_PHOAN|nr:hypothetical protein [Photobacterium angustum]KJG36202.1 hypothetical protein UA32_17430 [Photobacterium angustum]PSX10901.1 hypothetical protein C0W27_09730 [Photobacterium angustum]
MKKVLFVALSFLLFAAPSFAEYTNYTVLNSTPGTVDLVLEGPFCEQHFLGEIQPSELRQDNVTRGICMLARIDGAIHMDNGVVVPLKYRSAGTTYGQFIVVAKQEDGKWNGKIMPFDDLDGFPDPRSNLNN